MRRYFQSRGYGPLRYEDSCVPGIVGFFLIISHVLTFGLSISQSYDSTGRQIAIKTVRDDWRDVAVTIPEK